MSIPPKQGFGLKIKCKLRQEFVIGGYTEPRAAGSESDLFSLEYMKKENSVMWDTWSADLIGNCLKISLHAIAESKYYILWENVLL